MELTLGDDELRTALFDALLEQFAAKAAEDSSIAVVNRMPTVFAVSRHGNLLTMSQGIGLQLLRGDLKWRDRHDGLRTFTVGRATMHSKLAVSPDRVEATPDEILEWIMTTFLACTTAETEDWLKRAEPVSEVPPTEQPPASGPAIVEFEGKAAGFTAPVPEESSSEPAAIDVARSAAGGEPTWIDVTKVETPPPPVSDRPGEAEAEPSGPASIREPARPLRTYQLLLETAQRELDYARALPAASQTFLISAGVFAAFTAEAFFNDLGSRMIPFWDQLQRLDPREKAEVLNVELFNNRVDWSVRPFQSVAAALGFRRALAHAHAETLPLDQAQNEARKESEVPRTRRTVWQEHCDFPTIQRWLSDIGAMIEYFSNMYESADTEQRAMGGFTDRR